MLNKTSEGRIPAKTSALFSRVALFAVLAGTAALTQTAAALACEFDSHCKHHCDIHHNVHGRKPPVRGCKFHTTHAFFPALSVSRALHLDFDSRALRIPFNEPVEIIAATLQLTIKGKYLGKSDEVLLDLSGLKASASSNLPNYRLVSYDSHKNISVVEFDLSRMGLNGTVAALAEMERIISKNGQLRFSPHGKGFGLISSQLLVEWESGCKSGPIPSASSSPSPSSTPSPVAPTTTITSASLPTAISNSTTVTFGFTSNQVGVTYSCSLDHAAPVACTSPQVYSGLGNGAHNFKVVATNSAGLSDPVGASYNWIVNSTAPTVTITNLSSLPTLTNKTFISVQFASTTAVSFTCSIDQGAAQACTSPVTYSGLGEGVHLVSIWGKDASGTVSKTPATFQWSIDLTSPVISLTQSSPAISPSNDTSASFVFSANETSSFACSLDGAAAQDCVSPISFTGLVEGIHSFTVVGTDVAGNIGQPASYLWTVDLTPPVLSLGNVLPAPGLTNAQNISVEFAANEQSSYTCSLDGNIILNCVSPFASTITTGGAHEFTVFATDVAGNSSEPAVLDWMMDYTMPQLSWGLMIPSAATYINSSSFQATVIETEPSTLSWSLNGAPLAETSSTVSLSGLVDGGYTLAVQATDSAGNVGLPISHSFMVDTVSPVLTIDAQYKNVLTSQTTNVIEFSADKPGSTFQCNLDQTGYGLCASPLTLSGLGDGSHLVQVQATDLAGNVSAVGSVSWTVDSTPPVTTLSAARTSNNTISFNFTANESATYQCSLNGSPMSDCSSPVVLSGFSVGSYTFAVQATDTVGNVESNPQSYGWSVYPQIQSSITNVSPAGSPTSQTSMTISFAANQPDATFSCKLDNAAFHSCSTPVSMNNLADGAHIFTVRATDQWGTQEPIGVTYSWLVESAPPVISNYTVTATTNSLLITWITNTPATSQVQWGQGTLTDQTIPDDGVYVTNHSVTIRGLVSGSQYSVIVSGHDQLGHPYVSTKKTVRTN